ncbi:MAG: hypothetical protein Q7U53_02040 [Anaerolineaceae bacterium]|nr:hypothetical protein [Anaerolineaceae bacterium]
MVPIISIQTHWKSILLVCVAALVLSACASATSANVANTPSVSTQTQTQIQPAASPEPVVTDSPVLTATPNELKEITQNSEITQVAPTPVPTSRPTLGPDDWQTLPIVPTEISQRAREIYQQGLMMGNDPTHFSKLGDCQNITTYFLAIYDSPDLYILGENYTYLQPAIDHFSGSWSRESMSVKGGFNVASVFNPMLSNREFCEKNESPLDCELRLYQPSIVLISMEEWWNGDSSKYENYLRKIVDTVIAHGAVPVLATKADNMEGKHKINRAIANLAVEYDIPLWNFWLAVQPITSRGLQKDGFHLTHGLNDFSSSFQLKRGWVQRNLTALQVLDAVWRDLQTP